MIRWLGRVDFADGIWLGLELRGRKGKHDGAVDGRRYFTCKAGHGVFVRPCNVTVRGINGAKLVKPPSEIDVELDQAIPAVLTTRL